jgi:hypothetical protein
MNMCPIFFRFWVKFRGLKKELFCGFQYVQNLMALKLFYLLCVRKDERISNVNFLVIFMSQNVTVFYMEIEKDYHVLLTTPQHVWNSNLQN